MKIGFPSNPRKNLFKEIQWIAGNGFDFVDIFVEEDQATPERIDVRNALELLRQYDLEAIGHTAWYLPIGSPSQVLRSSAVQEIAKCFDVFSNLGVKLVTVHADWPGGMFSVDEGVRFQSESLNQLVDQAEKYGLGLMYELSISQENNVDNLSKVFKEAPKIHFNLDIGHANLNENNPEQFVRKFHSSLKHVHLHDNDGHRDLHLPMGCGSVNWEKTLRALKQYYNGTITLEIFSDIHYVLWSRQRLKQIWEEL